MIGDPRAEPWIDGNFCKRLDAAWEAFKASYAGLSDSELLKPGVTGAWSVRDIIAHVTTWEEEALKHLPLILEGGKPPRYSVTYGGIDAFNARMTEQKSRACRSPRCSRQLDDTHRRLVELIQSAPEDQLIRETRFRRRLRLDTYGHYPQHAEAIRQSREGIARRSRARAPERSEPVTAGRRGSLRRGPRSRRPAGRARPRLSAFAQRGAQLAGRSRPAGLHAHAPRGIPT